MPRNRKRWEILAAHVWPADPENGNPTSNKLLNATAAARRALQEYARDNKAEYRSYKRTVKAGGASMKVLAVVVRRLIDPLPHVTHTVDASIPRHVWPTITEQ